MPSLPSAATQPSPSSSLQDYDPDVPASVSVLQADVVVVFTPNNNNNNNMNKDKEQQFAEEPNENTTRNWDRPLFITLYLMLFLATSGLAFSLTRYVQARKSNRPPTMPSQATTTTITDDGTTGPISNSLDGSSNNSPTTLAEVDPDRDPVVYRSDIEYILSAETEDNNPINFLEGAQKKAIDWLVYKDLVLNSSEVHEMVEFIENENENTEVEAAAAPVVPTFPLVQRYAMMVLFFGTNGELWSEKSWSDMVNLHECKFLGVDCDLEGQAVNLNLAFRKLRGRLPDEVGMLTKLTSVNFLGNRLEGSIPSFIYNKLTNLAFLDLGVNEFTSTISSDISKLTNIETLHLSELSLTGQFPDSIKSLTSLKHLLVTHAQQMSGPLLEFSKYWPNLELFDIYQSGFTGTIPTTIGMNTKLNLLWLEDTPMNMTDLPTELGLLTNLEQFIVDATALGETGGTIPTELGNCQAMKTLGITGKHFVGSLPTELGRLTNMWEMEISGGTITGPVPSEIGLLTDMRSLSIMNNRIEGTLPSELGNIHTIDYFYLFSNDYLTGSIPSGMCESPSIRINRDCSIVECECCYYPCT